MKLERLLRSKFYQSVVVTDAFRTLEITQPQGDFRETRGIQFRLNQYPRGAERNPHQTVLLPKDDAFELAREIIRVHRGFAEEPVRSGDVVADHVGFHAMSTSEALMIEAVMLWDDAELRLALWRALRSPETAQRLLCLFVENLGIPDAFLGSARRELGMEGDR